MNITKYGISYCCGYGFFSSGSSGSPDAFLTNKYIVARSNNTTQTRQALDWTPQRLYHGPKVGESYQPVYVVFDFDSGCWREYFSGMAVATPDGWSIYEYDVDRDYGRAAVSDTLSIVKPRECTATEFADGVSRYTDKQIKDIVRQLCALNEDAAKWKNKFDAVVKAVKEERAKKEAGLSQVESQLLTGFGKYSNISPNVSRGSIGSQQSTTLQQDNRLQWIRQGRCSYCGGVFKGLFSKACSSCGQKKNY